MDIRDRKGLKAEAKQALSAASCSPKKLALISVGVSAGVTLVLSLINYFLAHQIGGTSGLSGLGVRAIWETVQSVLSMASSLALPFWSMGFLFACLRIKRREYVGTDSLLEGFRRFGPLLRQRILEGLLYMAVIMLVVQVGTMILMFTPLAWPVMEAFETLDPETVTDVELIKATWPVVLGVAVLACVVVIPVSYRLRMASYLLLDGDNRRALVAMSTSNRMMKGSSVSLLKLDLSFWWYFACQILLAVIGGGDMILEFAGISLHWAVPLVMYGVYLAGQLVLAWVADSYIYTTYAAAYDAVRCAWEQKISMAQNFPWNMTPPQQETEE